VESLDQGLRITEPFLPSERLIVLGGAVGQVERIGRIGG
jgi:hypothetical protein